uniref:HIG1 domain-containing protein n=1 Tax=Strongyloides venezuelensis TaxID=75913 RepID=A0A0K0FFB0_STRVS
MFKSYFKNLFCRVAECSTNHPEGNHGEKHHAIVRRSGVPGVSSNSGFQSDKETNGSPRNASFEGLLSNPLVPIGMGLTCVALLGMFKNSITGNKMGTQKYMRYRIYAQFGTVLAMVAGLVYASFSFTGKKKIDE